MFAALLLVSLVFSASYSLHLHHAFFPMLVSQRCSTWALLHADLACFGSCGRRLVLRTVRSLACLRFEGRASPNARPHHVCCQGLLAGVFVNGLSAWGW